MHDLYQVSINIQPVKGGFIVSYPENVDGTTQFVTEVVTTVGKAMRIARVAVEEFSTVSKVKDDAEV
jgi:hypothetical protein